MTGEVLRHPCARCGAPHTARLTRDRCSACRGLHSRPTGAVVDATTRYEADVAAQLFVDAFPDGASTRVVGLALGVSRESVRLVEAVALEKLRRVMAARGWDAADLLRWLGRGGVDDSRFPTTIDGGGGTRGGVRRPDHVEPTPDGGGPSVREVEAALDRVERRMGAVLDVLDVAEAIDRADAEGRAA